MKIMKNLGVDDPLAALSKNYKKTQIYKQLV